MPPPPLLDDKTLADALQQLPGWVLDQGHLYREWQFADFRTAFAFMTRIAELAEQQNHHPDWFNSYRLLKLWLHTHEAGGLTERDIRLAQAIQAWEPAA